MENTTNTPALTPEQLAEKVAQLQAENEQLKAAADQVQQDLKDVEARASTGLPLAVRGSYKGYKFADGHTKVRYQGELYDTPKLLEAAKKEDADGLKAKEVLDYLIDLEYAYFTKKK